MGVNGVPFKFLPAARLWLKGTLNVVDSCLSGSIVGGVGIDAGTGTAIPAWAHSPGALAKKACKTGLMAACKAGKGLNCAVKAATKKDMCEQGKDKCKKLGEEIDVIIPGLKKPLVLLQMMAAVKSVEHTLLEFKTSSCEPAAAADVPFADISGEELPEVSDEYRGDTHTEPELDYLFVDDVSDDSTPTDSNGIWRDESLDALDTSNEQFSEEELM